MEISTSILSVKEEEATQTFYNIEVAKTDYFHIDVMDGKFVEKDTTKFMLESTQTIKHISNIPLDIHLMVNDAKEFAKIFLSFNPGIITVHYESFDNKQELQELIEIIKAEGVKTGISIKPNTPVTELKELLPFINLILVMTVEPGLGGQKLIPETLKKIKQLRKYREKEDLDFYIEADGGINLDTIAAVKEAGADIAVVGTAIVKSENMKKTIFDLKNKH